MLADTSTPNHLARGLVWGMLADGRFPAGGHVHSAGAEAAVADGRVHDLASLEAFVVGRLWTVGFTDAAMTAAAAVRLATEAEGAMVAALDAEAGARIPVPALRRASRRQGRQLVRVATRCWPAPLLHLVAGGDASGGGVHLAVALGAVAVAAGLGAADAAGLSVHHAVATPAQAALRLLGLDPFAVAGLCARLTGPAASVADAALAVARGPLADLPARTGPLLDIAADEHGRWDMRLFAT